MNRKDYPSDISHTHLPHFFLFWKVHARKRTAPRKVDLYNVFCAILSLLRNGCV